LPSYLRLYSAISRRRADPAMIASPRFLQLIQMKNFLWLNWSGFLDKKKEKNWWTYTNCSKHL